MKNIEIRPERHIVYLDLPCSGNSRGRVIFVHGACARMQQFEHQICHLNEFYDIAAYDALGCGLSSKPRGSSVYRSEEMIADFRGFVALQTRERKAVALIGHSMGGAMVLHCSNPESTQCVVAISPPAFSAGHKKNLSVFELPECVLWLMRPLMAIKARSLLFGPDPDPQLAAQEKEASARNPVHMFKAFYCGIDRKLFTSDLINVPTIIIEGEFDKICPPLPSSDEYSKHCVQGTGHQCMQEAPLTVNETITKFLDLNK